MNYSIQYRKIKYKKQFLNFYCKKESLLRWADMNELTTLQHFELVGDCLDKIYSRNEMILNDAFSPFISLQKSLKMKHSALQRNYHELIQSIQNNLYTFKQQDNISFIKGIVAHRQKEIEAIKTRILKQRRKKESLKIKYCELKKQYSNARKDSVTLYILRKQVALTQLLSIQQKQKNKEKATLQLKEKTKKYDQTNKLNRTRSVWQRINISQQRKQNNLLVQGKNRQANIERAKRSTSCLSKLTENKKIGINNFDDLFTRLTKMDNYARNFVFKQKKQQSKFTLNNKKFEPKLKLTTNTDQAQRLQRRNQSNCKLKLQDFKKLSSQQILFHLLQRGIVQQAIKLISQYKRRFQEQNINGRASTHIAQIR